MVDDVGGVQKDTNYAIFKHRLSQDGQKEGLPEPHNLGNGMISEHHAIIPGSNLEGLIKDNKPLNSLIEVTVMEPENLVSAAIRVMM